MNTIQKRILLFLLGCIPVRLLFAKIAKDVDKDMLPYLGMLALLPVIGWLWIYFVQPRNTGPEVFGGRIWWNHLRPIHVGLYSTFVYLAFQKSKNAYVPLLLDAIFGLFAFMKHHNIFFHFK